MTSEFRDDPEVRRQRHKIDDFVNLQKLIAIVCIFIPSVLWFCDRDEFYPADIKWDNLSSAQDGTRTIVLDTVFDKDNKAYSILVFALPSPKILVAAKHIKKDRLAFRQSISHYAHSTNSYLFGMLYCMAAMLFIYNGFVYKSVLKRRRRRLALNDKVPLLNILAGISLLLVIFNPVFDRFVLHTIAAVSFFVCNVITIAFLPNTNDSRFHRTVRWVVAAIAVAALIAGIVFDLVLWGEWVALILIAVYLFVLTRSHSFKRTMMRKLNTQTEETLNR